MSTRLTLIAVVLSGTSASADELTTTAARPGYDSSHNLFWWKGREQLENQGFKLDGSYTIEGFFAPQLDKQARLDGLAALELDIDLATLVARPLGKIHIQGLAIHGSSPTNELMDLHGVSGNTAPQDVRLFEAWIEPTLGPLTLRAGLLAADQEFVYADTSDVLVGATFGMPTQFAVNVGNPAYPVATPGVSATFERGDFLAQLAIYDGTQQNNHGIPTGLGPEQLWLTEWTYRRDFGIGAWHHSERGNGVYAILDDEPHAYVQPFLRVGYSPDGDVRTYIDAGMRFGPGIGPRAEDLASVGVAFAQAEGGDQTFLEATYEVQLKYFTLQPAGQLIMLRDRTVGVFALRSTIAL